MVHKARILGVGRAWATCFAAGEARAVLHPGHNLTISGQYRVRRPDAGAVFPYELTLPLHEVDHKGWENRFLVVTWDDNYYTDTGFRARLAEFLDALDASVLAPIDVDSADPRRVERIYSGPMPFIPIQGKVQVLDIWLNGRVIGDTQRKQGEGRIDIRYYANILDTKVPKLLNRKIMGRLTIAVPPSRFWEYD
jgi:hypothetical protein